MNKAFNILFLCTGNSCRSQMAEGWAKAQGTEEEIMEQFRAGRDDIKARVKELLKRLNNTESV